MADEIGFEYFFQTAFEGNGFAENDIQSRGKSFDELMNQIDYAENWMFTLLKALKAWEAAMRTKKSLQPNQSIMYGNVATETNFFLYVFVVEPGAQGQPVIKRQVGKFDMRDYTNKLRSAIEFARPYLQGMDTYKMLSDGKD